MPGYYPASTYPFALQFLLFFGSMYFTIFGDRYISNDRTVIYGFAIQAILLALIPIFANIGGSEGYWICFIILILDGWFAGVVQGVTYYENAKLPGNYIGIFLTSQGLAGILSNVLRFISLEIWRDEPFVSTAVCYLIAVLTCLLCIPAQLALNKNSFALFYQKPVIYESITTYALDKETTPAGSTTNNSTLIPHDSARMSQTNIGTMANTIDDDGVAPIHMTDSVINTSSKETIKIFW